VQELSLDAFTILKSIRDHTGQIIDFEWTYVNPRAAEVLKHPIAELVGQRLLVVLPGNQENSELFRQYVQVVETGQPHDIELFYNAEGITGWFRNMTVKLEDGIAISFSDITQRKETEKALQESTEQLQHAVAELEQLNQIKDEFLSTVSHELRTPMTNIKMSIRLLELSLSRLSAQQPDRKIDQYLQILSHECDREINLINDLLDLQRLESGQKKITLEPIEFYQWLVMFVQPFQERTQARQQQFVLELPPTQAAEIYYDLKSLERIMGELLNNACKYTPPGHSIVLTAQQTLEQLEIRVSNFGVEIPAQALPHIFDRFYRVPSGDPWKQGGTGLGLALVKKLVEYLNGTIQVESHSGRTCFQLTLAIPRDTLPT
jgi:signal transduction histidine kinase